jgi:hypothetical protein
MPELAEVPEDDQGIDFDHPVGDNVSPLKEMSTGAHITENGEPVQVDANGSRVSV